MKRGVKVPGRPGCCHSGCCRSLVWAGSCVRWSVVLVAWCRCLVLLSCLVVWACFWSCSWDLFLLCFFEKRLLPREPSPRPVFRQVHPFTARAVTIYLAVGLVDVTFPYLLSSSPSVPTDVVSFRRCGVPWSVCCGSGCFPWHERRWFPWRLVWFLSFG